MNSPHYIKNQHLVPNTPDERFPGHLIYPAAPSTVPDEQFLGRENELNLVRITLGLDEYWRDSKFGGLHPEGCQRMRLEGPSGRGKRSLVLEVARRVGLPLYEMLGHSDMSPEDLVLAIVPRASEEGRDGTPLVLQASPLATALIWGGIVYFDAMHHAPEKSLAPLASLLDGRMTLYSGLTGFQLTPRPDAVPFFFFCSWDSSESINLPAFLEQRTLPKLVLESLVVSKIKSLIGKPSYSDRDELLKAATFQKQQILDSQIKYEIEALRETMQFSYVQRVMEYFNKDNLIDAFNLLQAIDAFPPRQRAQLQALRDMIVHKLRKQADSLASKNNQIDAAKGSQIYRTLFDAGYGQHYNHNNFAHCLMYEGKLDEALLEIQKALDGHNESNAVVWITFGEIMEEKREVPRAIECYRKAASLEPKFLPNGKNTRELAEGHLNRLGAKTNKK